MEETLNGLIRRPSDEIQNEIHRRTIQPNPTNIIHRIPLQSGTNSLAAESQARTCFLLALGFASETVLCCRIFRRSSSRPLRIRSVSFLFGSTIILSDHGGHCNHGGSHYGLELSVLLERSAQASTYAPSVGALACDRIGSWVWECGGEVGSAFGRGS